ncbi:MAG: glycosyltransferase [Candidatus Binatia bacterium]|nr:glycosyltransferase [Candidatus Binatia bacterium]
MKVLISSWDRIGERMAGSAIRSLEMARSLARAGHVVTLAAPAGSTLEPETRLELALVDGDDGLRRFIERADVVVVSGRTELMTAVGKPLVVDLYDPFVLSNLDLFGGDFNKAGGKALLSLRWLQHHLENGDFFICASEAQRSFWLGMLTAAGRVNRANYETDPVLERLLAVVPFGVPDAVPEKGHPQVIKGVVPGIGKEDSVVLWAGGMWNWVDPLTLIRATAKLRETRTDVKTLILGGRHPNPEIGEMEMAQQARALAAELGLLDQGVTFLDWVPYEERHRWILDSDVGVSLHRRGVESEFAFRTRLLDYLWCGRPMVVTEGDDLATVVGEKRLGRVVAPDDVDAVASALAEVLGEPEDAGRAERFAEARWDFRWSRVVEPLVEFCRAPRRAADRAGDAWLVPDASRDDVPRKEQALVAEEFTSSARVLSDAIGPTYTPRQRFTARYDRLCQVDVLVWFDPPLDGSTLAFEISDPAEPGAPLARVVVPAAQLARDGWQRFEFRPMARSRDREFEIRLQLEHAPGEWGQRGRICVWRCAGEGVAPGEGDKIAFLVRYLIAGVEEEMPVDADEFLFLHNTTLPVGSREDGLGDRAWIEAGPPVEDVDGLRASLARLAVRAEAVEMRAERLENDRAEAAREAASVVAEQVLDDVKYFRGLAREMKNAVVRVARVVKRSFMTLLTLPLTAVAAGVSVVVGLALVLGDLIPVRRRGDGLAPAANGVDPSDAVSVVIPTWNGRELLDMSLPPLVEALRRHGNPDDEILVVDNGSEDGTVEYLAGRAAEFPGLRVIPLDRNEGYGGATNKGALQAKNPALLFLNNDMVVEPDFVQPLLDVFGEEPNVFGVSCQIDFIDPNRPRWETGKVHAELRNGLVRLFHLDRFDEDKVYPVFFAGGGASAYDRDRFVALGGFDEAVYSPVYIEDVDLGYRAWKRGWPSLLAPKSRVHHKHRGTTRRLWSEGVIHSFFLKNLAALLWKNVSSWKLLSSHLLGILILPEKARREQGGWSALATLKGLARQVPVVMRARRRERALPRVLSDEDIFNVSRFRHVYRARFHPGETHGEARPQVLVVSPYSPAPAVHGGAVRMLNLIREMKKRCDVTLISFTDTPAESAPESLAELEALCRDVVLMPRDLHSAGERLLPLAMHGFFSERMFEMIEIWLEKRAFDVVQIEYTNMAHYLPPPCPGMLRVLVEHDVSFIAAERARENEGSLMRRAALWVDGLRTLRHEVKSVEQADRVLTMSENDRETLARFVDPEPLSVVPNGVSCREFRFAPQEAEPATVLFVGFFRHEPNVTAVLHFAKEVLPRIRERVPNAIFRVVGAYPPASIRELADHDAGIEIAGMVPETASHYRRATVFVAPILVGSGTRLKILEAMASGCPVVSTTVGAEGLGAGEGEIQIADDPAAFASSVARLIEDRGRREALAQSARTFAEENYDWPVIARRLFDAYGWERPREPSDA